MSAAAPLRAQVFRVDIGSIGPKPYAVVSNNQRNRLLDSVLAVRITSSDKSRVPTAVPLGQGDPLVGYALADEIIELFKDELEGAQYLGALAPGTVLSLNDALKQALGIGL